MVVPAEQIKQQEEKTKALEDKVKSHKRERILIYDAAMKQVGYGSVQERTAPAPVVN